MEWYHYFAGFWAGAFIGNFIPHFVNGTSGNGFPTPFSKPRGQGLSLPLINVIWGLFNLLIGYVLLCAGKVSRADNLSLGAFFAGFTLISIYASIRFRTKHKE